MVVASAGTDDYPLVVRPNVRGYLLSKGLDVRAHSRRRLTPAILKGAKALVLLACLIQERRSSR
jgi:hypothetical protein